MAYPTLTYQMQMLTNIITFESTSMQAYELSGILFSPRWQYDMVKGFSILLGAQIEVIKVAQELRQIKELGYEFLNISHVQFGGR